MTGVHFNSKLGRQHAAIVEMVAAGDSADTIAATLGISSNGMRKYCQRHGLQVALHNGREARKVVSRAEIVNSERTQRMVTMLAQGLTLQRIGDQFGITRERVRQLVTMAGAKDARREMLSPIKAAKAEQKRRSAEHRIYELWGIDRELHKELRANGTIRSFEYHRSNAKDRGIAFELTFSEWYAIWQASGKSHLRGRGIGHYCMSRIKDEGGYRLGNVHIQTNVKSAQEGFKAAAGREKRFIGVYCLYPGKREAWLAKAAGVRIGYFETAEEANAARLAYIADNGILVAKNGRAYRPENTKNTMAKAWETRRANADHAAGAKDGAPPVPEQTTAQEAA